LFQERQGTHVNIYNEIYNYYLDAILSNIFIIHICNKTILSSLKLVKVEGNDELSTIHTTLKLISYYRLKGAVIMHIVVSSPLTHSENQF